MVDVVIPVYKPQEELLDLLASLQKQTVMPGRIIIINTEKQYFDESAFVIYKNIEVIHIEKKDFDHAATRDMGMKISNAKYVLFMTMDAVPKNEHLIEALLAGFEQHDAVAVAYARQLPRRNCRLMEQYSREFNYPDTDIYKTKQDLDVMGIKTFFCSDVCAMYNHEIYDKLGGFVDRAIFNEDMFYAAKAIDNDYAVMYCANAMVVHSHNYTCKQQFKRNFDMGVSQAQHQEIFDRVSSEKEGIKLVKATTKYLAKKGHFYEIPYFWISCAYKLLGYRYGKKYDKLSEKKILKYTSNRDYWGF